MESEFEKSVKSSLTFQADGKRASRRSAYDLPIQYHLGSLEAMIGEDERDQFLSRISLTARHSSQLTPHRSRFERLDPILLYERIKQQSKFMKARDIAILKLHNDFERTLSVWRYNLKCEAAETEDAEIPHNPFSWAREDFNDRRKNKNLLWVEIIRKQIPGPCLEKRKLAVDVGELYKYGNLIFERFLTNTTVEISPRTNRVVRLIKDAHGFLDIKNELVEDLVKNSDDVRNYLNHLIAMAMRHQSDEQRRRVIQALEKKLMNADVWDPIEVRYQMGHMRTSVDQYETITKLQEDRYRSEIAMYNEKIKKENHSTSCANNAMYADIERFKNEIEAYNQKFKEDYDSLENQIIYKKLTLDKLKTQRKYLEEQIIRFHEEIEQTRLAEIAEQERQEQERKEALIAHENAMMLRKSKKSLKDLKKKKKK